MADVSTTTAPPASGQPSLVESLLPGILSRAKVVVSPYPFATSDDDSLRVTVGNSIPGVVVEVHGRLVTRAGVATPFRYTMNPTSNHLATSTDFALAGGFVSNLSAFAAGAAPLIGQTFVIVQIIRGSGVSAFVLGTLLSSYITSAQPIGWPGTPIQNSLDGSAVPRAVLGTDPPVGTEIIEVVPTGVRWEVLAVSAVFQCGSTVATRRPLLDILDSASNLLFRSPQAHTMVAGDGTTLSFAQGMPVAVDLGGVPIAGLATPTLLLAGQKIRVTAVGLQADDDFAAPHMYVREQLEMT